MEPQTYQGDEPGPAEDRGPPPLTMGRKKELLGLAEEIAVLVKERTKPHEGCFLRQAVEMLVDR